jgi:RNA polymerase sigma-70 factor (ECF subfamily)
MSEDGDQKRPALRVVPGSAPPVRSEPQRLPGGADAAAPLRPGEGARATEDDALLAAFLVGDDEAFGALIRRHERLVLSLVRRYARTPEDARDLAQRTFLRAFEAARRALGREVRGGIPFRRWLVRIAVNLAKNHLRDETRFTRTPLERLGAHEEPSVPPAAAELERAERVARVRQAVLRLPRRQREVLTLRVDAELPFAEVAAALDITENAARVSFHHATRRLRELALEGEP